jgi:hypothetical protein
MKHAVEMGSGAKMCARFHKDWFRHSEVKRLGIHSTVIS